MYTEAVLNVSLHHEDVPIAHVLLVVAPEEELDGVEGPKPAEIVVREHERLSPQIPVHPGAQLLERRPELGVDSPDEARGVARIALVEVVAKDGSEEGGRRRGVENLQQEEHVERVLAVRVAPAMRRRVAPLDVATLAEPQEALDYLLRQRSTLRRSHSSQADRQSHLAAPPRAMRADS